MLIQFNTIKNFKFIFNTKFNTLKYFLYTPDLVLSNKQYNIMTLRFLILYIYTKNNKITNNINHYDIYITEHLLI